eukprot:gene15599-7861_t
MALHGRLTKATVVAAATTAMPTAAHCYEDSQRKSRRQGLQKLRSRALARRDERHYEESMKDETETLKAQLEEFMEKKRSQRRSQQRSGSLGGTPQLPKQEEDAGKEEPAGEHPAFYATGVGRCQRRTRMDTQPLLALGQHNYEEWTGANEVLCERDEVWLAMDEKGSLVAMKTMRLPAP